MRQRSVNNEKIEPKRVRALPVISGFVAEMLPDRLAAIRESRESFASLLRDVRLMLKAISFDHLAQNSQAWPIALLDLKMLEIGLAHTARLCGETIVIPVELVSLIDLLSLATDRTAILTYEEIVLENPEQDPRTFTLSIRDPVTDSLQQARWSKESIWLRHLQRFGSPSSKKEEPSSRTNSEAQFYSAHRTIEAHMSQLLLQIRTAIMNLATEQRAQIEMSMIFLREACREMEWIQRYAKATFQQMRNEDFLLFREYLREHPYRAGPGASGAGSPSFAELDIRISGTSLPEQDIREIYHQMTYYSVNSRAALVNALEMARRGYSLMHLSSLLGHPVALDDAIDRLSQSLRIWRSVHYRIVADHLPEAIQGKDIGTGGKTDTHTYLHHKMHLHGPDFSKKETHIELSPTHFVKW